MVRLVSVCCPKCGASLKIGRSDPVLNCSYCGSSSLLENPSVGVSNRVVGAGPDRNASALVLAVCAGVLAVSIIGAYFALNSRFSSTSPNVSAGQVAARVAPQGEVKVNGTKGVPIVVQMFGDYECPFTERAWDTVSQLLAKYPGKIKLVWRNLPLAFHPHAVRAAETALEAKAQLGEDGFWKMTRLLLSHQNELEQSNLERHAESLGMNINALRAAWQSGRHRNAIQTDQAAAKSAGFSGTPAFLVGDVQIIGAQPFDKFSAVIESIMAKEL